jgi:hypothetical protein
MRQTAQKIVADRFRWRPLNAWIVPPLTNYVALTILVAGPVLYLSAN